MSGNQKEDLIGKRFGRWTVIAEMPKKEGCRIRRVLCKCDCGTERVLFANTLKNGSSKSCGCYAAEVKGEATLKDLTGKKFGRLTVIERDKNYEGRKTKWICECECGNIVSINSYSLTSGHTRSCGCYSTDVKKKRGDNLCGKRFGRWTVLYNLGTDGKHRKYLCKCDCGTIGIVLAQALRDGSSTSCGCNASYVDYDSYEDLSGRKYGKLTVLEIDKEKTKKNKQAQWKCKCECGNVVTITEHLLKSGMRKTCGCKSRERKSKSNAECYTRLYKVWMGMRTRCYYEKSNHYKYYGGRGIKVCEEWRNDFKAFKKWAMANGYDPNAPKGECTIDRINNDGDYEPSNCRFVSVRIQNMNKRERGTA